MSVLAGFLVGAVTGLFPGIHVNVTAAFLVALAPFLYGLGFSPFDLAAFILAAAVSHCYWELVPSLLLGVPSDEALALLPGHRLVREGRGGEALLASLWGSSVGIVGAVGLLLVLLKVGSLEFLESLRGLPLAFVLAAVCCLLIRMDRPRLWAFLVFMTSGLFGLVVLSFPGLPPSESTFNALFPALTGLFGTSTLLLALSRGDSPVVFESSEARVRPTLAACWGVLGGMGVGLLPGLGAGNMAALFDLFQRRGVAASEERYLARVAAVNTSDTLFGIMALYLLGRPRSGASVAIESIMPTAGVSDLVGLAVVALVAGLLGHLSLRRVGFGVARRLAAVQGRRLNLAILVLLLVLVVGWTGFWGLVVLVAATFLGMVAPLAGVRRTQAMGFLLVPTILFYSGWLAPVVTFLGLGAVQGPAAPVDPVWTLGVLGLGVVLALLVFFSKTSNR